MEKKTEGCSFELPKFDRFYGVSYCLRDSRFFEILASAGGSSYSVGGIVDRYGGKDHYIVTDLSSSCPADAFYDALPRVGVSGVSVILCGYVPDDDAIIELLRFWEAR